MTTQLSPSQANVLELVKKNNRRLSAQHVAARLEVTQRSANLALNSLVKSGFIYKLATGKFVYVGTEKPVRRASTDLPQDVQDMLNNPNPAWFRGPAES